MQQFDPALPALQRSVPQWWRRDDPTAELYRWLAAIAAGTDQVAAAFDQLFLDAFLASASAQGLLDEWAYVYDLRHEISSTMSPDVIRGYVQAWVACTGTAQSILNVLQAIINLNPANQGGTVLTFDAGGAGLTFPANGSGLTLFQYATVPDQTVGFLFPIGGAGLTFPDQALYFAGDDGSSLRFDPSGAGLTFPNVPNLTFPNSAWVVLTEAFSTYALTVTVKSYLAFDRAAFKRAIDRFRQAHTTFSYVEVNT